MIPADDLTIEIWPPNPTSGMLTGKSNQGIRITHKPSDNVVTVTQFRHQYQNKQMAMMMLEDILAGRDPDL